LSAQVWKPAPAWGLPWEEGLGQNQQPYKYNGKEFIEMHGLDEYYSVFRNYYPAIGRTTTMDPHAENYYNISPYAWCGNNLVNRIDPDGRDWYSYRNEEEEDEIRWTDYKNQESMNKNNIIGDYLGEAVVVFNGSLYEKLGQNGILTGEDANPAQVTIYGINGKDDIKSYNGLTVSSDPSKYSMVESGDYSLSWEQMATSPYGKGSLTYRVRQLDGNAQLPIEGGGKNKATGKDHLSGIFFHRTNWNGDARYSSQGCLVIDGRQWRSVEKQLEKSNNMLLRIIR